MPRDWPFIPDHISIDTKELDGQGIASERHVYGFLTIFSSTLKNPASVVEFSPDGKMVRTDSYLRGYPLHRPCSLLREYAGSEYCLECDREHALLFRGLDRSDMEAQVRARINCSKYIADYFQRGVSRPSVLQVGDRPYMEYDCPFLGYREVLFPIFVEDRVIGAVFLGEICLRDRRSDVRDAQKRFFDSYPHCFDRHHQQTGGPNPRVCRREIEAENKKLWESRPGKLSPATYSELLQEASGEIADFESTLRDYVDRLRDAYAKPHLDKAVEGIHQELPAKLDLRENHIEQLWGNLKDRLEALCDAFRFQYVAVFSRATPYPLSHGQLPLVTTAGTCPWASDARGNRPSFDASRTQKTVSPGPAESDDHRELLSGLPDGVPRDPDRVTVFTYPVPFQTDMPLVLVIGHDSSTAPVRFSALTSGLRTFEGVVVAVLASLLEAFAEERTRASYRILGHEAGQLTPGMEWIAQTYLSSVERLRRLDAKKADDLSRDIHAYVAHLRYLFNNANRLIDMIWALPELERKEVLALGELLHKWKDIYRGEIRKKELQLVVPPAIRGDSARPPIWGDVALLEQLVYNLINNAVKYCHRGTKIHLDCRLDESGSNHVLTVMNYGRDMPPGEHYYELFTRGEDALEGGEGLGVGLFLARQIARAHGGDVTHKSKKISDYNVPLIQPYLRSQRIEVDTLLTVSLEKELARLEGDSTLNSFLALTDRGDERYSNPSSGELRESIGRPTYEVTLVVTIPRRRGAS